MNILPDIPLLLTIYVVLVHCISDLPYILQSHCILPVFYLYICVQWMQVCATLPGEREVGAPLLKCIDWHPLCSRAPHLLAATLMKLYKTLLFGYQIWVVGNFEQCWSWYCSLNKFVNWVINAWMWCRMWNCIIIGRASFQSLMNRNFRIIEDFYNVLAIKFRWRLPLKEEVQNPDLWLQIYSSSDVHLLLHNLSRIVMNRYHFCNVLKI